MKNPVCFRVAAIAAGVAGPFLQEDRLNIGFEGLKIQGLRC
jgi:hypothetical protein